MTTEYHSALKDAVAAAFEKAQHDMDEMNIDAANHLMAQRRVFQSGCVAWVVRFSDNFDTDWMTHMFDNIMDCAGSVDEVAARIEAAWNSEWDDVQVDRPVGDFSMGSSDFNTRWDGK